MSTMVSETPNRLVQRSEDSFAKTAVPHRRRALRSPLWLCLLLALVVRVWLVIHTHGFVDADESLVGVQAQHILRGELPIYYYGQPYMGSLEAYFAALVFAIIGASTWALRITSTLLSLVLVWVSWCFAGALADSARLPSYARRWFQTTVGLFAALPPLYDVVIELRMWGGHIEIYILMVWLLLSALRLTQRWEAGASQRELLWRWLIIAFIIGLGMWIYPIIMMAVIPAMLWIAGHFLVHKTDILQQRDRKSFFKAVIALKEWRPYLRFAPLLFLALLVGFAPGVYYGLLHYGENVFYLFSAGSDGGTDPEFLQNSLATILGGRVRLYTTCIAPHVIGGSMHTEAITHASPYAFALLTALGVLSIVGITTIIITSIFVKNELFWQVRMMALLPWIFAACTVFLFIFSSAVGKSIFRPCTRDGVGRYAAPLLLSLPFFAATVFTTIRMLLEKGKERLQSGSWQSQEDRLQGAIWRAYVAQVPERVQGKIHLRKVAGRPQMVADRVGSDILSQRVAGRPQGEAGRPVSEGGRPVSQAGRPQGTAPTIDEEVVCGVEGGRGGRSGMRKKIGSAVLVVFLVLYLGVQGYTYLKSDPDYTFQSFACLTAPADNSAIIAYLQQQKIHYVMTYITFGNPIIFKTDNAIIAVDPGLLVGRGVNRLPANTEAIRHADRASVIDMVPHGAQSSGLLDALNRAHVHYKVARFHTQPGDQDILVVTPLSRSITPDEARKASHC